MRRIEIIAIALIAAIAIRANLPQPDSTKKLALRVAQLEHQQGLLAAGVATAQRTANKAVAPLVVVDKRIAKLIAQDRLPEVREK